MKDFTEKQLILVPTAGKIDFNQNQQWVICNKNNIKKQTIKLGIVLESRQRIRKV